MGFAGPFLLEVEGVGPSAVYDRLTGPFDEGLAQELGCGPPPMCPGLLAAFLPHGCHADIFLQGVGSGITLGQIAEGDEQPGRERGSGSRQ